jgi:hypothetical protein
MLFTNFMSVIRKSVIHPYNNYMHIETVLPLFKTTEILLAEQT